MPKKNRAQPFTAGMLAIVAYDQLRTFEYAIAAEVFALHRPNLGVQWYDTVVVAAEPGHLKGIAGVEVRAQANLDLLAQAQTIVLPGWRDTESSSSRKLIQALQQAAVRGARLLSICSGAFLLAEAGLLENKRATTHWLFIDTFRKRFPNVLVEEDVLYVDQGQIITSAGSAAGIDACLHLVRRDFGTEVANKVAKRMVTAPHREGGQAQFVEQPISKLSEHRRGHQLSDVLQWAESRLHEPLTVTQLAQRAAMSERHFLRQFSRSVGLSPLQWLTRERMRRACALLEKSPQPLAQIAGLCGYESLESFRVAFRRAVGVAPGSYRGRFGSG